MNRNRTPSLVAIFLSVSIAAVASRARADEPAVEARAFGHPGSLLVDVTAAAVARQKLTDFGDTLGTYSTSAALSAVVDGGWSLGLGVVLGYSSTDFQGGNVTTTTVGGEARGGRLIPLGPLVSWWLQAGLGYARTTATSSAPNVLFAGPTAGAMMLDLDAPLLLHPGPHFFLAAGPGLQARFSSERDTVALLARMSFGWSFSI